MVESIRQSAKTIECLRAMFPGKWKYAGGRYRRVWKGEKFSVVKVKDKFVRTDTREIVRFPKKKCRSYFIHKVLEEKFGGVWEKEPDYPEWYSDLHEFTVYRTSEWQKGLGHSTPVYRRSDTMKVVFRSNGRKFYDK